MIDRSFSIYPTAEVSTDAQTTSHKARSISITEYAADLARGGVRILPGGAGTFWVEYLYGSLMRIPMVHLEPPTEIVRMMGRNNPVPKTICEVGCGAGEVLKRLQKSMNDKCILWGHEVSPQAFELCKTRANERLHFKLADIRHEENAFFGCYLDCCVTV